MILVTVSEWSQNLFVAVTRGRPLPTNLLTCLPRQIFKFRQFLIVTSVLQIHPRLIVRSIRLIPRVIFHRLNYLLKLKPMFLLTIRPSRGPGVVKLNTVFKKARRPGVTPSLTLLLLWGKCLTLLEPLTPATVNRLKLNLSVLTKNRFVLFAQRMNPQLTRVMNPVFCLTLPRVR